MSDKKQLENELKEIKELVNYLLENKNNDVERNILNDDNIKEKFMHDYALTILKPTNTKKFIGYVEFLDTEFQSTIKSEDYVIPIIRFKNILDKNLKPLNIKNIYTNNKEWIAYNYKNVFKKLIKKYEENNAINVVKKNNIKQNIEGVFKVTFDVNIESGIIDYSSIEILNYIDTYYLKLDTIENLKIKKLYYNFDVNENDLYYDIDDYERENKKYYSKDVKAFNDWKLLINDLINEDSNICLIYEVFNESEKTKQYYIVHENNNIELINNAIGHFIKLEIKEKYNMHNNNYTLTSINALHSNIKSNYKTNSIYLAKVLYNENEQLFNIGRIVINQNMNKSIINKHAINNIHDLLSINEKYVPVKIKNKTNKG